MTKLTRNLIIGASSTAVAGGAAAGIAVAVVKAKDHKQAETFSSKDHFYKHLIQDVNPIYKEEARSYMETRIAAEMAIKNEMALRASLQTEYENSHTLAAADKARTAEQEAREFAIFHQHEINVRNGAAHALEVQAASDKVNAEENILAMKERVKAEVWQYARAEYIGCQNAAWRAAHKDLIVEFTDVNSMTVLARDWWYLLQADTVAQIKYLEKDMIFQIKKQYNVTVKSLID